MRKPNICRAIPKQRYKLGDYTIVVLEDIESEDEVEYEYLLAAIRDGRPEPEVYITCEKTHTATAVDGHAVRVFAARLGDQASGQIIDRSDAVGRPGRLCFLCPDGVSADAAAAG